MEELVLFQTQENKVLSSSRAKAICKNGAEENLIIEMLFGTRKPTRRLVGEFE